MASFGLRVHVSAKRDTIRSSFGVAQDVAHRAARRPSRSSGERLPISRSSLRRHDRPDGAIIVARVLGRLSGRYYYLL